MKTFLLIGNPNTGKSTLFNALTGLHQKVGNYPGITIERKEGKFSCDGTLVQLIDLPGTYSLTAGSPDEAIVRDILFGHSSERFDGVVVIADATNLDRNLYLATQVIDCGVPTVLVINMIDEARRKGIQIDQTHLSKKLDIPVFLTAAHKREGIAELKTGLATLPLQPQRPVLDQLQLPGGIAQELHQLASLLSLLPEGVARRAEALRLISRDDELEEYPAEWKTPLLRKRSAIQQKLEAEGIDWRAIESESRYTWIDGVCTKACSVLLTPPKVSWTDRIDGIVTHKIFGPFVFFTCMAIIFQALFSWATWPMDVIDGLFGTLGERVTTLLPEGPLASLLVHGAIAGIGGVIIFIPQIAFLFFLISLLEDSGYMARAAFVMDRLMEKFGLPGKAFVPLVSSFACAIPGIMAARTIESRRDRLVTILVAPLMSCSARLPVYTLLIAACIPAIPLFGFWNLQGAVLWSLYLLGILAAIGVAFLLKRTILTAPSLPFLIEFPPYRVPQLSVVLKKTWERVKLFLTNAGTIIFALSIFLWFLTSYPGEDVVTSFAGMMGKAIEPLIEPLGFNWKIGIGLIASFAAREVFVSTMAIVYSLEGAAETSTTFINALRADTSPDGTPVFTPLVALSLLVFYVLACQCISTVAVVKRETNTWRWPLFLIAYMTFLAYGASLVIYQGGRLLGF